MKKLITLLFTFIIAFSLASCSSDAFGHIVYTNINDYSKIFELTEIRFDEDAFELFPQEIKAPENAEFYCEWELGVVGSSKTEICLSVNYTDADYKVEIDRLKSLADNKIVYDVKNFKYPAYVTILDFKNTNYYALVDEQNKTIHYVLLQIINEDEIDINKNLIPNNYGELGEIKDISFNVYE